MVVELDEGHRALHPVIERALLAEPADPAEMRLGQMPLDLGDPRPARAFGQRMKILVDQVHQLAPLQGAEARDPSSPS